MNNPLMTTEFRMHCSSVQNSDTTLSVTELILCLSRYYCIVNTRIIIAFINSSLYSYEMYTQVKEMDNLNLFIDSHYKYIVSIIRVKHILTLHLSTAN